MIDDDDERVVLVSETDEEIGEAPKLDVHLTGHLHRAFSVFVHDAHGRILLQRRAATKYHSPGLWSNTCCGHPRPGEPTGDAAMRRLKEEMGLYVELLAVRSFIYHADLGRGLVEHELDHVFVGKTEDVPRPDPSEVDAWRWIDADDLALWMQKEPEKFTAWLPAAFANSM